MRKLFFDFFSHRALFYGLFNQAAKNIVEMSELLSAITDTTPATEREPLYKQINILEEAGDDITHKIYLGLDKVFFTPLNRKDIHTLASAIDDVADNIHEAAGRMNLYEIDEFIPSIGQMAKLVQLSCTELQTLINALANLKDTEKLLNSCRMVKDYEHQVDDIYYHALADLFAREKDAITLIKHRDILFSLEASANKCKNVTDALEIIILNSI